MKNIVIPVDFSEHSRTAAKAGAYLARKTYARIHLLHVVYGPENWNQLSVENQQKYPEVESRIVEAGMKLEKLAQEAIFSGLNVVTQVKTGIPHERVISFATATNADLIVMGAHGLGDSDPVYIGSTTQKVIRAASCPVLSVKTKFDPASVKRILFASDFEENVSEAIDFVTELAIALDTTIDFAFVNTPGHFVDTETIEQRMRKAQPAKPGVTIDHFVYNHHEKDRGIIEAAKKRGAGVIAMITHDRKRKPPYSFGITESVLFLADSGVISVIVKK
jgi:nucleotide-binding universal stress UspA family protein